MRIHQWLLLSLLALSASGDAIADLKVERVRWGFGGKPMCEAFNLLTVEMRNDGDEPFVGVLSLEQGYGMRRIGAPEVQPCSIAPYGSRVVQFAPYLDRSSSDWRLTWRVGKHRLEDVRWEGNERKAVVEFSEPQKIAEAGGTSGEFPRFPEAEFPGNPSVTEALAAVVLDHTPAWEAARAQSFLTWLKRGGRLHVFRRADGTWPKFRGALEVLNDSELTAIEMGMVQRHDKRLIDLSKNEAASLKVAPEIHGGRSQGRYHAFRLMGLITRSDVNWGIVYLVAFAYVVLLGPGLYVFCRRKRDYRIAVVSLLGLVLLFSWLFARIGRRGFGESDRIYSASVAKPVSPGVYDVQQWSHVFVTEGNDYQFQYPSQHQLFRAEGPESVPGAIKNGVDGGLDMDLPLYSSRNLLSRQLMNGPVIEVSVNGSDKSSGLSIKIDGLGNIEGVLSRRGDRYYEMSAVADAWEFFGNEVDENWENMGHSDHRIYRQSDRAKREVAAFEEMNGPLMHWHQHANPQSKPETTVDGHQGPMELIIFAKTPDTFFPTSPVLSDRLGRTMYVLDITRQVKAAQSNNRIF